MRICDMFIKATPITHVDRHVGGIRVSAAPTRFNKRRFAHDSTGVAF